MFDASYIDIHYIRRILAEGPGLVSIPPNKKKEQKNITICLNNTSSIKQVML